jgi:hypothetical protein
MLRKISSTLVVVALASLSGSLGCASLAPQESPKLTAEVVPGQAAGQPAFGASTYTVELRTSGGQSQTKQQELTGPLRVQEALEGTKADKKFKRFFVALDRPLPDGRAHHMELTYDRGIKRLEPEYDYAILPGDRIVVTEDKSTVLDDLMERINGPLGGVPGLTAKKPQPKYRNMAN